VLSLAIAQFRPRKGDYEENLCRLGAMFREAAGWTAPPGLILAPEAALTGYFLEGGVRDLAVPAEKLFGDLVKLEHDRRNGRADERRYSSRRAELIAALEAVYSALDDSEPVAA